MAATFGITQLFEFTVPVGCLARQVTDKNSIENFKKRGATGTTVRNIPGKLLSREVTFELDGSAPLSLCTAGEFTEGVLKCTRVRGTEGNEDTPQSTVVLEAFSTYPPPAP